MPTQVDWGNETEMILHVELIDQWTWDEAYPTFGTLVQMMQTTPSPVSMLIDLTRSAGIPSDALTHSLQIVRTFPANWELSILIGGGAIVRALTRVFSQLHPTYGPHLRLAASVEDGRRQIASHRQPST